MQYSPLGRSGIEVSRVCLGSMTWGLQNNQSDADEQIEYALARGVNFIDTAEMYAVPPSPDTYGKTETIIGDWIGRNTKRRKDVVIASKIAGPGMSWVRGGGPITGESIISSVDASLKRLQTDYIDLYQLHWPNRTTPHFGKHWPNQVAFTELDVAAERQLMLEILQALDDCVKAGKIRFCGLSDDTTWGISQYLQLSEKHSLPRMVSIQNEFNLLHAKDWPHLIEHCVYEDVAYLPWSPLGGGVLSGKYLNGARPSGSRWTLTQRMGLFRNSENVERAVAAYKTLAEANGMSVAQLALRWCDLVDGVTSSIIGATSMTQLKEDIDAFSLPMDDELLAQIGDIFKRYPSPF